MSRGITNKQAKYLARLQRDAGEKYTGDGLSAAEASRKIEDLKDRLGPLGPTPSQLDYLAALMRHHGLTYHAPQTREEASRLIDEMKAQGDLPHSSEWSGKSFTSSKARSPRRQVRRVA